MTSAQKSNHKNKDFEELKVSISKFDGSTDEIICKISVIESDSVSGKYKFEVDEDAVKLLVNDKLKEVASTVKMQGFRQGKVPLKVVESKYKLSAMKDVMDFLIERTMGRYAGEKKLKLATQPKADIVKFDESGLEYDLHIELLPEIKFPDFKKINLEKPIVEITAKEIDKRLAEVASANKSFAPAEKSHKAQIGDALMIDYEGKIDGEVFETNSARLEIGSKTFIDNFEDQLIGTKADDKKIVKVKFPKEYHAKQYAGKAAEFDVKVKEILQAKKVEINDEFAQKLGFENVEKLQNQIKLMLENEYSQMADNKMRKELFDELDQICKFDLPPSMVKSEFDGLWANAQKSKAQNPNFSDKKDSELEKDYKKMAERRVKLGILLAELGREIKVEITNEDLQKAVYKQALMFQGQEAQVFEYYKKNASAVEALKGPILEDKVVKHIFTEVALKEKKYTPEKLAEAAQFE